MRKPTICIGENEDADQLRCNCEAKQCLCFCYTDSTLTLLKSKISSFKPASVTVQPGLCQIWSETTLLVFSRDGSFNRVILGSFMIDTIPTGFSTIYDQCEKNNILPMRKQRRRSALQ